MEANEIRQRNQSSRLRHAAKVNADQIRLAQEHAEMRELLERMSKYAEYVHRLALQRQTVEDFEMGRDLADLAGTVTEARALLQRIQKGE